MEHVDFNHPDIVALLPPTKIATFKKGEIILHPLDDTHFLHTIHSGLVKVFSINARGEENIIVFYGKDDMFPLNWIVDQKRQQVYFQAISDCKIALYDQAVFIKQLQTNPKVSYAVTQKILDQFYLYSAMVNNMGFKYARERVAYRLLIMAARLGDKKGNDLTLPHITQQDLGSAINVSREKTNREISRFEKLGIITYEQPMIMIHKPDELRKELGEGISVMFFDEN